MKLKDCLVKLTTASLLLLSGQVANGAELNELALKEASARLNQELFSTRVLETSDSIASKLKNIETLLDTHAERGFNTFNNLRPALLQLGYRAVECETRCADKNAVVAALNKEINRDAGTATVLLTSNSGPLTLNLFDDFLTPNCTSTGSTQCKYATDAAIDLWRITGFYRSFSDQLNSDSKTASKAHLSQLEKQWMAYKDETIKLWPQEVLLSSIFYRQNNEGFTAPPNYKLLALRPSIGLSYFSDGSPDLRPSLNVDLLGVYWWQYHGQDNADVTPGRGLSLSAIITDNDTALGLSYHHGPRWSATVAHSDDNDLVFSVSVQLIGLLFR